MNFLQLLKIILQLVYTDGIQSQTILDMVWLFHQRIREQDLVSYQTLLGQNNLTRFLQMKAQATTTLKEEMKRKKTRNQFWTGGAEQWQ